MLNVWRAATDNDGIKLWADKGGDWKPLSKWQTMGLHQVRHQFAHIRLVPRAGKPPIIEVAQCASGRERWDDFNHVQRYALESDGTLHISNTVKLGKDITDIPRVGISMMLPPGLERLEWFGRGPWDNYCDRKSSAMIARYCSTVAGQYVPYIMPQEHGHKTDVRWLTLTDGNGAGIEVAGLPLIEFNASQFTDHDVFRATHTFDLAPRPEVILNIDYAHRGLGTASCGPDTIEKYRLLQRVYTFAYRMRLIG